MPKKTVIVGLGGTGDWVLTLLKSRLYAAYGESELQEDVQFLLADTIHTKTRESAFSRDNKKFLVHSVIDHHEEEVAHLGADRIRQFEYVPMTGDIHSMAESVRQGQDEHTRHLKWFSADYYLRTLPAAAMNITDGAGQWRQFGRLGLTLSVERNELPQRIERAIRSLNVPPGDALMFYVVSSLAGGTGAGTFLDMTALIRDTARRNDVKVCVVGFLALPGAYRRVLADANMEATAARSFAAFRELVRFQTQAGQSLPFSIRYSIHHEVEITTKLFDTVFLFDARVGWKNLADVPPWSGISPVIADVLEVLIELNRGSVILQDLINASARMASQARVGQTLPAQFHSMGSYKIVLPARQYGAIFVRQFVIDFLQDVFATSEEGALTKLRTADRSHSDYHELARGFVGKIPNLFTQIVDMLGEDARSQRRLWNFSNRPLAEYRSFLLPKTTPQGIDPQVLAHNPLQEVETGKTVGDNAEDAARRIVRDGQRRLDYYWEKLDKVIQGVVDQLKVEISAELNHQTREILNRRIDGFAQHPVGTATRVLQQIVLLCDDLILRVLKVTEQAIDAQNSGQNSFDHWKSQLTLAQKSMEATRGLDGFFNRGRAWDAQSAYLEVLEGYLERRRLAKIFHGFRAIVDLLKQLSTELAGQLQEWANTATLDDRSSARVVALRDISEIEGTLLRAGQSYTSSYGLKAYEQDREVDLSMNGYRQKLYERFARPLLVRWRETLRWDIRTQHAADEDVELSVVLMVQEAATEGKELVVRSAKNLYQSICDRVRKEIVSQVTSLSIFDYFLDEDFSAVQVAEFLKQVSGPWIGALNPVEGATPTHTVRLLAQKPRKKIAADFLNDLQKHLRWTMKENFQEEQPFDFDNPYTLTLLHIVENIREGQLQEMKDYEHRYNRQILESDIHMINHIFTCEQQAAQIEKTYRLTEGIVGPSGWRRLHPRIVRLLDHPDRLRLYLKLWALQEIRLELIFDDQTLRVWMVLLPDDDDPRGPRAMWLTAPWDGPSAIALSPLLAIEQFCLLGYSARPGAPIKIDYQSLADLVEEAERVSSETNAGGLTSTYELFLDERLEEALLKCQELHSAQEAEDLRIVIEYYLLTSTARAHRRQPKPSQPSQGGREAVRGRMPQSKEDADALEKEARTFLLSRRFERARSSLAEAISNDPEREPRIRLEFGFLNGLPDTPSEEELWCYQVWKVLSRGSDFRFDRSRATLQAAEQPSDIPAPVSDTATSPLDSPARPEEKGEVLEVALLDLFGEIFQFTEEQHELVLKSLRKQQRGGQFGHDLSFKCELRSNREVRCHVECKNYKSEIPLKEVLAKLQQEKAHWAGVPFDYWILVSPHTDPSNDLRLMLERWEAEQEFSFGVQAWTPETRVREFFGLHPPSYDQIYPGLRDEPTHPSNWPPDHRARVLAHWIGLLEPRPRIPREWISYLKAPSKLCMRMEDPSELDELYRSHVPLGCRDAAGIFMPGTLEENTRAWLEHPDEHTLLILGDFGDGKSVFTYILARRLAEEFLSSPSMGWIPLRIPLRDLTKEENARGLLRRRLEEFGGTLEGWNNLRHSHQVLTILDGYDEISIVLDPATVTQNIKRLIECRDEFTGLKLLVTSRTRVFDNRNESERLLQRLGNTQVVRIAPISRSATVDHLERYATDPEDRRKLQVLRGIYDPVGMAEKPLFLGMIKETLRELPETRFNQAVLYETYVDRSLRRKIDGLEDEDLQVSRSQLIPNLKRILEWVATGLFNLRGDCVLLSEFPDEGEKGLAKLLWRLSSREASRSIESSPANEEDARARVGVRSLLKARKGPDPQLWPVDFFHRSMREYFLARAITRALSEGTESAAEVLRRMPLPHEVVNFVVELIQYGEEHEFGRLVESCETNLSKIARLRVIGGGGGNLGGNALTILYRVSGEVPGEDWSDLTLDGVDLAGADLSKKSFKGSSLRGANLNNANLERADFRDTDLCGVRIERTAAVTSLAAGRIGGRLIAGYGDETVREWILGSAGRVKSSLLVDKADGTVTSISISLHGRLCASVDEDFVLFGEHGGGPAWVRFPTRPDVTAFRVRGGHLTAVFAERGVRFLTQVELNGLMTTRPVDIEETALFDPGDGHCLVYSRGREELVVEASSTDEDQPQVRLKVIDPSCVAICPAGRPGEYLVGCGQRDGRVRLWRVEPLADTGSVQEVFTARLHDGVVTALAFLDEETVSSGGHDRTVRVAHVRSTGGSDDVSTALTLRLNIRCRGMLIEGVRGEAEFRMLQRLVGGDDDAAQ